MSVAVDANVLVYASHAGSPEHERAVEAVERAAGGTELLYVFWPVAMAYLRIVTHPRIFQRPLPPRDALANLDALLGRPNVRAPGERDGFWREFRAVCGEKGVRGNAVPDAQIVALMRQYGVRAILSRDRDFRRFDGIRVRDPFD